MFDVDNIPDSLKALRKELGLSQDQFGRKYRIPITTLRNWEQSHRYPDTLAINYLFMISTMPEEVAENVKLLE